MKTILITGASGYIGKNITENFSGKYMLLTPSHKELDLLDGNAVEKYFKKNRIDFVINCAVVGGSRKEEEEKDALNNNLRIFFNIVRNEGYFKKMIHLGSGAEYDKSKDIKKIKEEEFGLSVPKDDYGLFKYICSKYVEKSTNKIIVLRIFGLYGKYEDYRLRFISNAICRNILGLPIEMNQDVYFDYVYINDFVKIVDYFINNDVKPKFYNIGTGKRINLLSIADKINNISGKKSKIIVRKAVLNREYTCDNSKLLKELDNFEFTDFDKSIKELYLWYKNKKSILKL